MKLHRPVNNAGALAGRTGNPGHHRLQTDDHQGGDGKDQGSQGGQRAKSLLERGLVEGGGAPSMSRAARSFTERRPSLIH